MTPFPTELYAGMLIADPEMEEDRYLSFIRIFSERACMSGKSDPAFNELVRILEEAVRAGVVSIGLEYKGGELMVFHQAGSVGFGAGRIPKDSQQAIIEEIVERAGLARRRKGKTRVTLLGRDFDVLVERYDSFGESAFNLTLREREQKAGG